MVNPWIGALVITIGVIAAVVFSLLKVPEVGIPSAVTAIGIAILAARTHVQTTHELRGELQTLKDSIRPPSLVDPHEKSGTP